MPIRLILLTLLFLGLAPSFAHAQTTDAQERIAQLEEENQQLRQQLAELRFELNELKREMRNAENHAGENEQPDVEAMPDEPGQDQGQDNPAQEGEDAEQVRTFTSADQIYRSIPDQLSPARDGWDIVKRQEVADWLRENIPGNRFEARLEVNSVTYRYHSTQKDWAITIQFKYQTMRFMNWDMEQRVTQAVLRGDGDYVDHVKRRVREGSRVNVSGVIRDTSWGLVFGVPADENWHPEHCAISLDEVEVRF